MSVSEGYRGCGTDQNVVNQLYTLGGYIGFFKWGPIS